ncbi:hypothetical protein LINPERHAP1_LOCUS24482 [Linum perenne]
MEEDFDPLAINELGTRSIKSMTPLQKMDASDDKSILQYCNMQIH